MCTDAGSWVDIIGELGNFSSDYVSFLSEIGSKVIKMNRDERILDILRKQERHERHPQSGRRN